MPNTTYTTQTGERWDTVAEKAYGDSRKYSDIIRANPTVPITTIIPANTVLNIPILPEPIIDENLLPPWKR